MLRKALRSWIRDLPDAQFIRIHRAAIINLTYFDHIERTDNGKERVYLQGLTEAFRVSQRSQPGFNRFLKRFQPAAEPNSLRHEI